MHYRTLGQTNLTVSEIGLGALPMGGMVPHADGTQFGWAGTDDQESLALIHQSEACGVNLLDTAAAYGNGHSETLIGQALRRRQRWIISTKVMPQHGIAADTPNEPAVHHLLRAACEQSLRRLHTDYIDVYLLHRVPPPWAMPVAMEALARLRAAGNIRWYGISTNNRAAITQLRGLGPLHVLQIGYNLLERSAEDVLHWARTENIGTLIRVPLAKGMLTGKYSGPQALTIPAGDHRYARFQQAATVDGLHKIPQLAFLQRPGRSLAQAALRFVLDHPGVSCVLAGAKTCQHAQENAGASDVAPLSPDELARALPIAATIGTAGWVG